MNGIPLSEMVEVPKPQPPDLRKTGETFGDWLVARERLHLFLTGETVVLMNLFEISEELLSRTDIMPVFRPVGASNRTALDWKVKLGMNSSYEEVDVMKYRNSEGPKVPELYYINRSVRPDEDTLGKSATSPDQLVTTKKKWLGLYGWSDADNLFSSIKGVHLDSNGTWSWFPYDRLLGDKRVAFGHWIVGYAQAWFNWYDRDFVYPYFGARLATPLSLKPS